MIPAAAGEAASVLRRITLRPDAGQQEAELAAAGSVGGGNGDQWRRVFGAGARRCGPESLRLARLISPRRRLGQVLATSHPDTASSVCSMWRCRGFAVSSRGSNEALLKWIASGAKSPGRRR